nr:MLO11 [Cucumis sativus]WCO04918.1 2-18 CRISPR MLO11 [Cucumis sativus]
MAGGGAGRSLEETPTWAVAAVCFVLVLISIIIEHILHLIGKVHPKPKYGIVSSLDHQTPLLFPSFSFVSLFQNWILVAKEETQTSSLRSSGED